MLWELPCQLLLQFTPSRKVANKRKLVCRDMHWSTDRHCRILLLRVFPVGDRLLTDWNAWNLKISYEDLGLRYCLPNNVLYNGGIGLVCPIYQYCMPVQAYTFVWIRPGHYFHEQLTMTWKACSHRTELWSDNMDIIIQPYQKILGLWCPRGWGGGWAH